ncbi:hypothetical protein [Streptomyces ochraceiscleroticus]|uniref:Uncharacterized protein n=1 Tax=Streptomyces ochraceiscleroticus TaxID=47761 RepID=A0ABW1MKY1_9ACTN|nr:hypothetical protein [Streptomyces ochraceiscleroticus]
MELTEIPGNDLHLDLASPVMEPETGFDGILRIGEVLTFDAVKLAGSDLDAQVSQLVADHDFTLVRIPVSVRPTEATKVRFMAVEIDMAGGTCWSLDPDRVDDEIKVSSAISVGAGLKPNVVEISANHQRSSEYIIRRPSVLAFGVGLDEAAWEFNPARADALAGVQLLHLVAKTPRGTALSGTIGIKADIVAQGLLWNTRAVGRDATTTVARFG